MLLRTASFVPRYMSEHVRANGEGMINIDAPLDREQLKKMVESVLLMIDLNDFEDFGYSSRQHSPKSATE